MNTSKIKQKNKEKEYYPFFKHFTLVPFILLFKKDILEEKKKIVCITKKYHSTRKNIQLPIVMDKSCFIFFIYITGGEIKQIQDIFSLLFNNFFLMASNEIQDLGLAKLPTAFFPAPSVVSKNSKPRVVNIAYDQSNFGDAMIAKAIGLGFLNPNDDIRILHIVNQSDYTTLFSPMISANVTNGTHHDFAEENIIGAADDLIWQVINVLKKRGVGIGLLLLRKKMIKIFFLVSKC
jgi:hypothetical protein